jgi:transglutaminase-like putative cysteine protease
MLTRPGIINPILLLLFTFVLREHLTDVSIAFAVVGMGLVILERRPPKLVRTLLALGILASYWFKYGKLIDPEVGLNFLLSVIVLKLLEGETRRDRYMVFFGMILLLSAGSLFEKNLSYVIFYAVGFGLLVVDFYRLLAVRGRLKDLGLAMLWVLPLTGALFFLVPRALSPLPFPSAAPGEGKIGYTPDLNLREMEKLERNDEPVFRALIERQLGPEELYWRGNVLARTDGWQWYDSPELNVLVVDGEFSDISSGVRQQISLFNRQDYFFGLERPREIAYSGRLARLGRSSALPQTRNRWVLRYEVLSAPDNATTEIKRDSLLHTGLSKSDEAWIHQTFRGQGLAELGREVEDYLKTQRFKYSLEPGKVASFRDFMREKRVGFCAHYASSLGLILRTKGIPARLVSGFMGGQWNPFANFYMVTQNDAHVWVEALDQGQWVRLDPTSWISPERMLLGGEAFMQAGNATAFAAIGRRFDLGWLRDAKLWFDQWDYRFYQFMDELDYNTQAAWLTRFNFKREWLFYLVPGILLLFTGIYAFFLLRLRARVRPDPVVELWQLFHTKARERGFSKDLISVAALQGELRELAHPEKELLQALAAKLVRLSFESAAQEEWRLVERELRDL